MSASGLSTSTIRSSAASSRASSVVPSVEGARARISSVGAVDILREHGLDGAAQVRALVQHGHDECHSGALRRRPAHPCARVGRHAPVDHVTRARRYPEGVGLVSDAKKAAALVRKAVVSRSAVRDVRHTIEALPPHPPHHYRVAVYFADGAVNMYQMRQWYKPLAELAEALAGRRAQPHRDRRPGAARRGRAAGRVRADGARSRARSSPSRTSGSCSTSTRTRATSRCSATAAAGTCSSTTASPTRCT